MHAASSKKPAVAVFGAMGHVGRLVVNELVRRNMTPITIAREASGFGATGLENPGLVRRIARIEVPESIDWAIEGAAAVINCAGPFVETAEAVVSAAIRQRIHYVDLSAEGDVARSILRDHDKPARRMGMAAVPGLGFFGGLADLLVTAAVGEWETVDAIEVSAAVKRWQPTEGMRQTIARIQPFGINRPERLANQSAESTLSFGASIGENGVVASAFSETALISHHLTTRRLSSYLNVADADVSETLGADKPEEGQRSGQRLALDVDVWREGEMRRASFRGHDIYAVSAMLAVAAAERLILGRPGVTGAFTPGELFEANDILHDLDQGEAYFVLPPRQSSPAALTTGDGAKNWQNGLVASTSGGDAKNRFTPLEDWDFSKVLLSSEQKYPGSPARPLETLDIY